MAFATEEFIKQIDEMTVLDLNNLVKALEDHYGVSAAAAAVAVGPAAGGGRRRRSCRRADRVRCRPHFVRRQEDQRHQGGPRGHQLGPQGSQGSRRVGAGTDQGRRLQGRGRRDQEEARGCRRAGRAEVGWKVASRYRYVGPVLRAGDLSSSSTRVAIGASTTSEPPFEERADGCGVAVCRPLIRSGHGRPFRCR